jgi:hypothetical protein
VFASPPRRREVALARQAVLERLAALPGVSVRSLDESYQPPDASIALHPAAPTFTPASRSRLVQHLVEATAPVGFSGCQGLLAAGSAWLYEANLANAGEPDRIGLSRRALLARILSRRWNPAAVPPGWWRRPVTPRSVPGPLLLLASHNNPNYHHWLTLPGLAPLMLQRHFALPDEPAATLGLTAPAGQAAPAFVDPLLALVAPDRPVLRATALTSPWLRFALQDHGSEVVVSPALLAWWRDIWRAQAPSPAPPRRRLFISRQGARSRRCLNEAALLARLLPLGFERLQLEALPLRSQLEAFADAAVVVGAHGAGLTNLVACQPGATLVELLPGEGPFHHYFLMASLLGVRHSHLIGERPHPGRDDFTVEPDQLLALLALCGIEAES